MTESTSTAITDVLTSVAAHGLSTEHNPPASELPDAEFGLVLEACGRERTLGLLGESARSGSVVVTDDQWRTLDESLGGQHAHGLRVERLLLNAVDALAAARIETRVLKGIALAHSVYPAPEWRVFADADLLLPSSSFDEGIRVLVSDVDARRDIPELRSGFDSRFGKEVLLRSRGALELDVHRTFVEGALGLTVSLDDLFVPGTAFTLAHRTFWMLPAPQLLLHAAFAAVLADQPPRLMSLRDVVQIALVLQPSSDDVLSMARRWRAECVLARALTNAWDTLALTDAPDLLDWARSYVPARRELQLLDSHVAPNRAHLRHLAALRVLPSTRDRAAYLRAIVWPDRQYLEARGFTRRGFTRRGVRSLR